MTAQSPSVFSGTISIGSIAGLSAALAAKQDAASAATDAELAIIAAQIAAKQDASTAATDAELAAETTARQNADTANANAIAAAMPKAGGTFTGAVTLAGDPTGNLQPATRQYVDQSLSALINGAPSAFDTLKEIADQLSTDAGGIAALNSALLGKLSASANLSDLANVVTARTNLGLGSAATHPAGDFEVAGSVATHIADHANPHVVTKAQVGLANVDNTSDVNKPVSTAQQTALNLKLDKASNLSDVANAATSRTNLGLGNVDNTSDVNKPVSTAQQTALDLKANIADIQVGMLSADRAAITDSTFVDVGTVLDFALSGSATEAWQFSYWIAVTGDATMDIKFKLTTPGGGVLPAGSGGYFSPIVGASTATPGWSSAPVGSTPVAPSAISAQFTLGLSGTLTLIKLEGVLFGGGTAGTIRLQGAQNLTTAANLVFKKGCSMIARKVSA